MKLEDIQPGARVVLEGDPAHNFDYSWLVTGVDHNAVWLSGPGDLENMCFARPDQLVPHVPSPSRPKLELVP